MNKRTPYRQLGVTDQNMMKPYHEKKKAESLLEAVKNKDTAAIKDFEDKAKSGEVIRLF